MKKLFIRLLVVLPLLTLFSCDVHEWPEPETREPFILHLNYSTDFPMLEYNFSTREPEAIDLITRHTVVDHGRMRYHVKAYPKYEGEIMSPRIFSTYEETSTVSGIYDRDISLNLLPGEYRIFVWSDLRESETQDHFYDLSNFEEIKLTAHQPNTDFRDCFRGVVDITVTSNVTVKEPDRADVRMERPVAKFEFITNDLKEFLAKEAQEAVVRSHQNPEDENDSEEDDNTPKITDYKVKFSYVGFMPSSFSLLIDKPSDSVTGSNFDGVLKQLNENEASMGFDYVYTGTSETSITVQITINDKADNTLSVSDPIKVPLKRSQHTVISGSYLMVESNGGLGINPDYEGDYNLFFP